MNRIRSFFAKKEKEMKPREMSSSEENAYVNYYTRGEVSFIDEKAIKYYNSINKLKKEIVNKRSAFDEDHKFSVRDEEYYEDEKIHEKYCNDRSDIVSQLRTKLREHLGKLNDKNRFGVSSDEITKKGDDGGRRRSRYARSTKRRKGGKTRRSGTKQRTRMRRRG